MVKETGKLRCVAILQANDEKVWTVQGCRPRRRKEELQVRYTSHLIKLYN